jgi:hypothetical protein
MCISLFSFDDISVLVSILYYYKVVFNDFEI